MKKKPNNLSPSLEALSEIHEYNISVSTREIWLHSHHACEDDEIDFRSAATFCKNIQLLNRIDPKRKIIIHMQSLGGDWVYGMAIYDAVLNSSSPVVIIGESAVCSMATIIMQAATHRYLMPNSDFMIHSGSFAVSSDTVSAMSDAEQNQKDTQKMFDILARRAAATIKSMSFTKHMKFIKESTSKAGNWWIPADQAVRYGFVDGVIDGKNIKYSEVIS